MFSFSSLMKVASVVSDVAAKASPATLMLKTAVEAIDALSGDGNEEKRVELYMELAADMSEFVAVILRAAKDGEITAEEHAKILKEFKDFVDNSQ